MSKISISKNKLGHCLRLSFITLAISALSTQVLADKIGAPWTYEGKYGPAAWGKLDPVFEICSVGTFQSPVDIQTSSVKLAEHSQPVSINYHFKKGELLETQTDPVVAFHQTGNVIHNGHTLQIDLKPSSDNNLTFNNKHYELVKFHFHAPGEHQIDGKTFPIEAHYIHQDKAGDLLVIGVFITVGKEKNQSLEAILKGAPKAKHTPAALDNLLDLHELIPADSSYYSYPGSLTTPPCSQNVQWIVLEKPITATAAQIKQLEKILDHNARPLQQLGDRKIEQNIIS